MQSEQRRNLTLVIAWDREQRGPLAVRLAVDLRDARKIAEEMLKEYSTPRISFLKEVEAIVMPPRPDAPNDAERFLHDDGWEAPWIQELEDAKAELRAEEREHRYGAE
jgi:hypothetical protein